MPTTGAFETHADRYAEWFDKHPAAYASELQAVRELWPADADGLEIGVGAGHFAGPLGIRTAVEPAAVMSEAAARRGIDALDGAQLANGRTTRIRTCWRTRSISALTSRDIPH